LTYSTVKPRPSSPEQVKMSETKCYWASAPGAPLEPAVIQRRNPGPDDVVIDIQFAGICHSDIHQARDEWSGYWGKGMFPM
jgi:uncharacterized zinc-type alcohol dehydrogenase-like protein